MQALLLLAQMLLVQRLLVIARYPVLLPRWARPPQFSLAAVVGRFEHWAPSHSSQMRTSLGSQELGPV